MAAEETKGDDICMPRIEMKGMESVIEQLVRGVGRRLNKEVPNDIIKIIISQIIRIDENIRDKKTIYNLEDLYNDPESAECIFGTPFVAPSDEMIKHYIWDFTFVSIGPDPPHIGFVKCDLDDNGKKKQEEQKQEHCEYGVLLNKKESVVQSYGPKFKSSTPLGIDYDPSGATKFMYNVEMKKLGIQSGNSKVVWCKGTVKLDKKEIYCLAVFMKRGTIFNWDDFGCYSEGYKYGKQASVKRKGDCVVV